jgi:glycosyltransferase involved in cell wall biosynthesis
MIKILMIGTFLSERSGTKSVSEKLASQLIIPNLKFVLVSTKKNKLLRLLEICFYILFCCYDKIHIDTYSGSAFKIVEVSSFLSLLRQKKILLTLHGGALPVFYSNNPKRVYKLLKKASYIQSPSYFLKEFFERQGLKVKYLPNSIDLSLFTYERGRILEYSMLWVRAFDKIYNPDLAIKTLFEVQKMYPSASLTMIGPDKGQEYTTVKLVNDLGLNNSVRILGPVKNEDLPYYYHTHHVFLNTTSFESFGMAVVEAAACGIPVVTSKVGEIPYLWNHEENMMIVEDLNADKFSVTVIKLLDSPELTQRISINARLKAEQFDWEVIKKEWIQLLVD